MLKKLSLPLFFYFSNNKYKRQRYRRFKRRLRNLIKPVISFQMVLIFAAQLILVPIIDVLNAQPFGDEFKRSTNPKGRLENYYDSGDRTRDEADWNRIIQSGKDVLSAEWEYKSGQEIENYVKNNTTENKSQEELKREAESAKTIARAEWESQLTKEIDERRGEWKAKIQSESFKEVLNKIDYASLQQAVMEADAILASNTTSTATDRVASWDADVNSKTSVIRTKWEEELTKLKSDIIGSAGEMSAEEKKAFEEELARVENYFQQIYSIEESKIVNSSRQNNVLKLNKDADLQDSIARETDPSKLVDLLLEKTRLRLEDETGDIQNSLRPVDTNISASFDGIEGDATTKVSKALEMGEKLWADAIENLLIQKLKYDKEAEQNRRAGETAWSEAYTKLLSEREVWRDKINKDIQEGLKAWDESETALKENKDKALEELNRYMESSKNQWYSHVSGMQNVLVSSADSIETIVSNKEWFQKKVNWFNARIADPKETGDKTQYASLRDTYQGELNYWINMEGKYRQMITNSQDFIHNTDVRNTTGDGPGLLDNNGSETDSYVYTVEEFNLKIAKKELLLLEQKKKEAETVYNYAIQNAGTKTSEEIAAELDQKRAEYETKQKTYLDLLTELNGGVGDASSGLGALANNSGFSENNTTTQTATQTTTSLQADLEAANKILEEKRKALELKRTDLDTARIAYEEALKLQVLVNNPDLLLNVNSISITGDTDEYTDFRKEINAAISQISEANEKVRQQEAAYYPILLERQNALRTQDYYNYINQKILDFEDTKGRLADLRALLDNNGKTTAEKMELLINPTDRDLLVEIYGNEVSANLKSQLTELKTSLEQGDTPIVEAVESFLNDYTLLNSYGEGVVNSFSQAEKLKVQNYLNTIKNTGNQLSSLQGVDTTILQNESLLQYEDYLSRLLNGWDDQLASFEETKTTYDTAYNEFTAYINANPDKKGSAEYREKVLKFGLVAQNYLNVTSTIQQYSKAISNSGNAINTIILDLLQKSTVLVDSTLVGKDRENRLSEINNLKEAHKNSITGLSEALTAQGTAYTEVNQNAAKFYSSYQNVNNAVEKRTVLYENSYNFLNGIVETLRSNYESQKNQLTFLLNENGNLNTLNSMQDNLDITWKKEAARVNQRAAEILKNLVSNLNPSQRNLSVIIGDFENNLQKDYANYYSNPTFQLEVSAKKSVLGYLKKNYLQLNNSFMSSYDDFVSNTNNIYEQSNEILNFYANGGFFPPSDLERIKTSGTDAEKRLLYEFYSPGRMMMFAGTAMNEIAGFQNTFNEFKQFAEGAKSGEILTVLKEDYFREQENKSTGLYNELMTAIPSLGNLSSDQLYGDTASANAPREFDSVETEDRRRLLADLLGTVTLENVEEKVALLNNPANSQSILPDDIREDLLNDINTLLYGLQTDRIAPTETAEVLDRFIDTYRILEKNYLNNENNNQIIPRTRDLLVQAGTFTKIMELGNSRFPAINTRRTTRDANGVDPGGNGYIETFEYSDVNGKYIDDPDYRDINGLSINQDGFKQIDGFRYPPIQNVDDYTFLDAQGKVMSYYDAIIDTKNKYEVSAENVKTALDDLLAKQANDPNYTLSEEYINDVRNFKDIMVNHSSLASFLGYNYSLLNEFTRNFDEKLNAAIKQIKTSIDLDPDKNFIVSNSGNNQPDGDTLPQILEAYNQNPQSFIVMDSSDPSYSETERWLINLDYYTKGTTLKLIDTTYTGMLSTASQYNYIEAVNREVLKILDQYDRKDEKLSQLKDVIDNLPSRIEIYKPAVAVNQISPDQMINAYKDIRNYFAEKEFKGEEIENGLRDILNEVAPLTDELENLQYYKDNQNKDTSTSDTELQTAVNYTENLTKINNILTGLSGIMGSLDASGNFAYTSIDKINSLIAQYEKIKTEIANANGIQIPTSIETKIIELKSFAFETHKRNLALAYLSSQVGKEDIAGVNLLDEFIDSLKSGKYVMQGENGGPVQKDANFLGSPLNDAQLTEIKNYLKLYDAQSIVLRKENISDIETYISTADPEIQESIRKQAEFVSYQKINYSLAQGTYPDFNQISPSLLNYAVISSFQSFLNSKDEDDEFIYNEADIESRKDALNDFVLSSGITDSTLIGGISEFVDNFTSRNTSYYLPDFLKERNIQEKYYSMSYTAGITPGDMTAITNWLVDQKYESSLSNELNSIARMDYISKNYYGEENKNYLQEIDSSLTNFTGEGLTEEEKETFLLTNNGLSDSLRSHEYNPYYMIKSQNFTRNFNYENDYNSLKEEITNFQLALKKEMLTAEDNKRKEKFLNDALKGAININSYLVYSNTSQIGSKGYENDFTLNDRITARMKEVENLAEKKFGGFMNMLENFNSKAFIDAPMYSTNYSIRKTLSAIKNGLPGTNEMGESVDPFSYNVNDDVFSKNSTDGTYEFAGGLNNVKVAVDSFVTMTTNGSANVDRKLAEISRNQGIISSSSGSIITTGQTIEVLSQRLRSHNGDMVALLTEARNTFNYREGLFNTAQSEFNTQQNSVNTIQKAYDEKQLETSSAYQDMETAADNLKEITKLYEYQVLLESTLDSSLSPEDQAEDALGQDLKSKLIALAKKRRDDSISEYNKKAEEIKNLQSIVDKQVTLSDLNNNSQITTNRQETEDWALRAMRYSKAQKEIKAEIATLESEIRGLKNTLNGQIVPVLGNPPGGLRNSLEGYLDFAADDYILTENYYRDAYRLVNGIVDNKIGGWDFLSATSGDSGQPPKPIFATRNKEPLKVLYYTTKNRVPVYEKETYIAGYDDRPSFSYGLSRKFPEYNIRDFYNSHTGGNLASQVQDATNGMYGFWLFNDGKIIASNRLNSDYSRGAGGYEDKMNQQMMNVYIGQATVFMALGIYGWAPLAIYQSYFDRFTSSKATLDQSVEEIRKTGEDLRNKQRRLNELTDIDTVGQLREVLTETGQLAASDFDGLITCNDAGAACNGSESLANIWWQGGKDPLSMEDIAGSDGLSIFHKNAIHDDYGFYVRDGVMTAGNKSADEDKNADGSPSKDSFGRYNKLMVRGDEFADALFSMAKSQYEIERDEYYISAENLIQRNLKIDEKTVLDDREQFLYQLMKKAHGIGVEYGMYKEIVKDYMGDGGVVQKLYEAELKQREEKQIAEWDAKEKDFYERKNEWLENVNFLKQTGEERFSSMITKFLNQREEWRVEFNKKAKEGADKHKAAIKEALEKQSRWRKDFLKKSKKVSERETLAELFDSINGQISSLRNSLPSSVTVDINANDILSKILKSKPSDGLDSRMKSAAKFVDNNFFLTQITENSLDNSLIDQFKELQEDMMEGTKRMNVLQTLDSLYALPESYEAIINQANIALAKELGDKLSGGSDPASGFYKTGNGYSRIITDLSGKPEVQLLPDYQFFQYQKPTVFPTVKDGKGRDWVMSDLEKLMGEGAPSSKELEVMVKLAKNAMDRDFKLTYDPNRPVNRETSLAMADPKAWSKVISEGTAALQRLATDPQSALNFAQADKETQEAMKKSAGEAGYLVGSTEGGAFGEHHFNQFYGILKLKELYDEKYNTIKAAKSDPTRKMANDMASLLNPMNGFKRLAQVAGQTEAFNNSPLGKLSQKYDAAVTNKVADFLYTNDQMIDTVVTVGLQLTAAVGYIMAGVGTVLAWTGVGAGVAAAGMAIAQAGTVGLAAWKAARGAIKGVYEGGFKGFVAGALNVGNAYTNLVGVSYDLSYSYEDGFGASVGVGYDAGLVSGEVGFSYSEKEGFGAGVSARVGTEGFGAEVAMTYSQKEGFGGSAALVAGGLRAGVQYSQSGGTQGFVSYSRGGPANRTEAKLTYDKKNGFAGSLSMSNTIGNTKNSTSLTYNKKEGFGVSISQETRNGNRSTSKALTLNRRGLTASSSSNVYNGDNIQSSQTQSLTIGRSGNVSLSDESRFYDNGGNLRVSDSSTIDFSRENGFSAIHDRSTYYENGVKSSSDSQTLNFNSKDGFSASTATINYNDKGVMTSSDTTNLNLNRDGINYSENQSTYYDNGNLRTSDSSSIGYNRNDGFGASSSSETYFDNGQLRTSQNTSFSLNSGGANLSNSNRRYDSDGTLRYDQGSSVGFGRNGFSASYSESEYGADGNLISGNSFSYDRASGATASVVRKDYNFGYNNKDGATANLRGDDYELSYDKKGLKGSVSEARFLEETGLKDTVNGARDTYQNLKDTHQAIVDEVNRTKEVVQDVLDQVDETKKELMKQRDQLKQQAKEIQDTSREFINSRRDRLKNQADELQNQYKAMVPNPNDWKDKNKNFQNLVLK